MNPDGTIAGVNEASWQSVVCDYARLRGWRWWHFADSRRQAGGRLVGDVGAAGFPDLVLAHPVHGVVFAELKGPKGRLTAVQVDVLDTLVAAGARVRVWRPDDWHDVRKVLDGLEGE